MTEKIKLEEGTQIRPAPQKPSRAYVQNSVTVRSAPQSPATSQQNTSVSNSQKASATDKK